MNKAVAIIIGGFILAGSCYISYEFGRLMEINKDLEALERIKQKLNAISIKNKDDQNVDNDEKNYYEA